jgi:hypothetical protein
MGKTKATKASARPDLWHEIPGQQPPEGVEGYGPNARHLIAGGMKAIDLWSAQGETPEAVATRLREQRADARAEADTVSLFGWADPGAGVTFIRVPEWLWETPGLSLYARGVYVTLASFLNRREGSKSWPSTKTIADVMGVSQKTVERAINELEAASILVRKVRKGTSSLYRLKYVAPAAGSDSQSEGSDSQSEGGTTESRTNHTYKNQTQETLALPGEATPPNPKEEQAKAHAADLQRVWAAWCDLALVPFGRKAGNLTTSRERAISRAVKEMGADVCIAAIRGAVSYWTRTKPDYLQAGGSTAQIANVLATNPGSKPLADQIEWWAGHDPQRETLQNGGLRESGPSTSEIADANFDEAMAQLPTINTYMKANADQVKAAPGVFEDAARRRLAPLINSGCEVVVDFDAMECRVLTPGATA